MGIGPQEHLQIRAAEWTYQPIDKSGYCKESWMEYSIMIARDVSSSLPKNSEPHPKMADKKKLRETFNSIEDP